MNVEQLGPAIRAARVRKGITQEALAELLDITPIHLKNIEGSRRKPSVPLLFQMMELLDFSVDALVFPSRQSAAIHTDGLSDAEIDALTRLVDVMRRHPPADS
ncbi:MAG: helix-turn-helix transcriptional regulator [Oscillospiraceae bacterium]|nr:helix-turn-helix transcriptional regulator [Oscillospiraceae bacterium]